MLELHMLSRLIDLHFDVADGEYYYSNLYLQIADTGYTFLIDDGVSTEVTPVLNVSHLRQLMADTQV